MNDKDNAKELKRLHIQSIWGFRITVTSLLVSGVLCIKFFPPVWSIPLILSGFWGMWLLYESSIKRFVEQDINVPKRRMALLRSHGVNCCSVKHCKQPMDELNVIKLNKLVGPASTPTSNGLRVHEMYELNTTFVIGYCNFHAPHVENDVPNWRFLSGDVVNTQIDTVNSTRTRSNLENARTVPNNVNVVLDNTAESSGR